MFKSGFFVLISSAIFALVHGSSIPIWEFLKREEKEINIYSIFAKEVENQCKTIDLENCNKELLKYGLDNLKKIEESELDILDPYQHDAQQKIWKTLLSGHKLANITPQPKSATTAKPNSYDDESIGDDLQFGNSGSASAKIDNVYRVAPPKGFIYHPVNSVPAVTDKVESQFISSTERSTVLYEDSRYAVKVNINGMPLGLFQPLPQDDDLSQYRFASRMVPYL